MKFLNFGSLNVDHVYAVDHFVRAGETLSASDLQLFCGGKGLNQSIALRRCGVEVYHGGAVGADGQMLVELLKENGVHTEHIFVKDCPSGHAIIQNDKDGQNCIMLFGGANQALTKADVDTVLEDFSDGDFILLQNEINQMSYIMEKAHKKGMTLILNPSPADEKIFSYPLNYVDYLILNEIEIRELYLGITGKDGAADTDGEYALADKLLELFPEMKIILTLGSRGSVYKDKTQTIFQKAYKVKAVDTTAAGDTFTGYVFGGIVSAQEKTAGELGKNVGAKSGENAERKPDSNSAGEELSDALGMAARASALAVTKKGAAPSIPWRNEVEEFEILS